MNERQESLLKAIIRQHLRYAEPVGSKMLAGKNRFNLSSATIRNEMAFLEANNYIYQPHTSAGRVPTEKAYLHFLKDYFTGGLADKENEILLTALKELHEQPREILIKELAKKVAELSETAVVLGFSENSFFYTGLSKLFSQPEFKDPDLVYDLSLVIDHLDSVMGKIFNTVEGPEIYIGKKNPFGAECSVVIGPWRFKENSGVIGLLGPMRMDYSRNIGLINFMGALK